MSNMTKEQLSETLDTVKPYEAHCSKSESRKTKIQDQSVDSMEHLIQRFQQEAEAREMILSNNLLSAIDARLQRKRVRENVLKRMRIWKTNSTSERYQMA